jgi:hypothetical protein
VIYDEAAALRIFHDRLQLDKATDESFRWKKHVDGVPFELYIYQVRVPRPVAKVIEVSVFDDPSIFTALLTKVGKKSVAELSSLDRLELSKIGVEESYLRVAGDDAIIGAAFKGSVHTQTVRNNASRRFKELEFGDPYVPQSLLRRPYPDRLLFLVRSIY